jgi:hypothetical protein
MTQTILTTIGGLLTAVMAGALLALAGPVAALAAIPDRPAETPRISGSPDAR